MIACRKDSYFEDRDTIISPPTIFYLISVSGVVTNENNEPLQSAEVIIGDLKVVTDKNGAFLFRSIRVPEDVTVMHIRAIGYESATRLVIPEKGKWLRQDCKLYPKNFTASFSTAEGTILELERQARLEIPANAVKLFNGNPYSGEVRILAEFLDPNNAEHVARSPGLFLTGNGLGNKKSILSHGILHITMETPNGIKLILKPEVSVKFKAPVLPALLQQSIQGAAVWYLDESIGNWKKGPDIHRVGSFFEINLTELSWITYGASIECAWLNGYVQTSNKIAFNQSPLEIKVGEFYQNKIIPGADGRFRFLAPKHNSVKLRLKTVCNSVIYSRNFNSLTADTTNLDIIRIPALADQFTISGNFYFCPDKNHNLYLLVQTGNTEKVLFPDAQNVFSGVLDNCNSADQVKISIVNTSVGITSSVAVLPGRQLHYDLGRVELCDENVMIPSYAYLSVGPKTYFSIITDASLKKIQDISSHQYELSVSSSLNNRETDFEFILFDPKQGYSLNPECGFKLTGSGVEYITCNLPSQTCDLELIISDYHGPGFPVKGTFGGSGNDGFKFEGGFNIRVVEKR